MFGLERPPQLFLGIVAQCLPGGGFKGKGQHLCLAAAVGVLIAGAPCHVELCNQPVEIVAVISLCGHGEERGVALVPTQRGAHRKQVAQGDFAASSFGKSRQVFAHRVVDAFYVAFFARNAREETHDAFCGREDVGGEGVAAVVAVILEYDAVVLEDEKCRCLHRIKVICLGR